MVCCQSCFRSERGTQRSLLEVIRIALLITLIRTTRVFIVPRGARPPTASRPTAVAPFDFSIRGAIRSKPEPSGTRRMSTLAFISLSAPAAVCYSTGSLVIGYLSTLGVQHSPSITKSQRRLSVVILKTTIAKCINSVFAELR